VEAALWLLARSLARKPPTYSGRPAASTKRPAAERASQAATMGGAGRVGGNCAPAGLARLLAQRRARAATNSSMGHKNVASERGSSKARKANYPPQESIRLPLPPVGGRLAAGGGEKDATSKWRPRPRVCSQKWASGRRSLAGELLPLNLVVARLWFGQAVATAAGPILAALSTRRALILGTMSGWPGRLQFGHGLINWSGRFALSLAALDCLSGAVQGRAAGQPVSLAASEGAACRPEEPRGPLGWRRSWPAQGRYRERGDLIYFDVEIELSCSGFR